MSELENTMPSMLKKVGGFTLVEMIVAITITAILSAGIVSYIGDSVEGFNSSANRNQLASSGRSLMERLALELHNAVPNSVRVTSAVQPGGNQCLEMTPFLAATTYLNPSFSGGGSGIFEIIDTNPQLRMEDPNDLDVDALYAVIYPINTDEFYSAIDDGSPSVVAEIAKLRDTYDGDPPPSNICTDDVSSLSADDAGRTTVCLVDGADGGDEPDDHRFDKRSPVDRIYLATTPISFCVVDNKLYRYEDYGFQATQCDSDTPACLPENATDGRHLLTDKIDNDTLDAFTYLEASLRLNAIVSLELQFEDQGDTVKLKHEIQLRNVP
ncbi:MAG: type II secretion system protein [Pseudohongiellaceae bacterium]|nr:type II secretion system protein [Pseudohongiellaceae bacterium]